MIKTRKKRAAILAVVVIFAVIAILLSYFFNLFPQKEYSIKKFNIKQVKSSVDFNSNGIDDYTDIMLEARKDAENYPEYNAKYWGTGYPPDNIGVHRQMWYGVDLKMRGYNLYREMIDKDISNRPDAYTEIKIPDSNIDFRRVKI